MSPLPEWCGAEGIARYYGITTEEVIAATACKRVVFIDLPGRNHDPLTGGARLYYTPGFAFLITCAVERRARRIEEAMDKHLAEVINNGGRLP
jgi:hypothetical protein